MRSPPDQPHWIAYWYLLGTPVLALLDFTFDASWRIAGLENGAWRLGYYGLLMIVGLVIYRAPLLASLAGVLESGLAVGLVLVAAWQEILHLPSGASGNITPTTDWLMNLLVCGSVGIYAFNASMRQLRP